MNVFFKFQIAISNLAKLDTGKAYGTALQMIGVPLY